MTVIFYIHYNEDNSITIYSTNKLVNYSTLTVSAEHLADSLKRITTVFSHDDIFCLFQIA